MIEQQHLLQNYHDYQFGQWTIPSVQLKYSKPNDVKIRSKIIDHKKNNHHPIIEKEELYAQMIQSMNKKQNLSQKQKKITAVKKAQIIESRNQKIHQKFQKQKQCNILKNKHTESRSQNKKQKQFVHHLNQAQSQQRIYFLKQKSHHSLDKHQNLHLPSLNKNKNHVLLNQEQNQASIFTEMHQKIPKTIKVAKQKLKPLKPEQIKLKFEKKIKAQQKIRAKDMAKQFWKDEDQQLIPHQFQQYGQHYKKNISIFKMY